MAKDEQQSSFVVLQQRSRQTQTALELTHEKLRSMEEGLADFLDEYYAAVGGAFEQLSAMKHELSLLQQGTFSVMLSNSSEALASSSSAGELKRFYRDLARECHPDSAGSEAGSQTLKDEMMKTLNAAYARKNLSEMWQLKWELEREKREGDLSHAERLALLKQQQAQMQETLQELTAKESELRESGAWKLMQHARLMQCCGQDFVAMVKGRVERQLEDTKRELREARYKAKYWGDVKMVRANSHHS